MQNVSTNKHIKQSTIAKLNMSILAVECISFTIIILNIISNLPIFKAEIYYELIEQF